MEVSAGGGGARKHVSNHPVCTSVSLPERWGHGGKSLKGPLSSGEGPHSSKVLPGGQLQVTPQSVTPSVYDVLRGPPNSSKPARRAWILTPGYVDVSLSQPTLTQMERDWGPWNLWWPHSLKCRRPKCSTSCGCLRRELGGPTSKASSLGVAVTHQGVSGRAWFTGKSFT